MPDERCCETCIYWAEDSDCREFGWCFRFPPAANEESRKNRSCSPYPYTCGPISWCGEYKKDKKKVAKLKADDPDA